MEIHHLNCGTMRPFGQRFVEGQGSWFRRARLVTHCLLLVHHRRLLLVDTGFGSWGVNDPNRIDRLTRWAMQPDLRTSETALAQIRGLDFDASDVQDVVLTHLDVDHAGGLADFPDATVHLQRSEHRLTRRKTLKQKMRFFDSQWDHDPEWNPLDPAQEDWFGFDAVPLPVEFPGDPTLVSLPGHSPGHAGLAVRNNDRWLLHAGDAYFHSGELESPPHCPPALRLLQWGIAHDNSARKRTQKRLRRLKRTNPEVEVFSAHNPEEYEQSTTR